MHKTHAQWLQLPKEKALHITPDTAMPLVRAVEAWTSRGDIPNSSTGGGIIENSWPDFHSAAAKIVQSRKIARTPLTANNDI